MLRCVAVSIPVNGLCRLTLIHQSNHDVLQLGQRQPHFHQVVHMLQLLGVFHLANKRLRTFLEQFFTFLEVLKIILIFL